MFHSNPFIREEAEGRCSSDMLAEALKVDSHPVENVFERSIREQDNIQQRDRVENPPRFAHNDKIYLSLKYFSQTDCFGRSGSLSPPSPNETGEAAALLPIVQVP